MNTREISGAQPGRAFSQDLLSYQLEEVPVHLATRRQLLLLGLGCEGLQPVGVLRGETDQPLYLISEAHRETPSQVA